MAGHAERVLQLLELPYRVICLSPGLVKAKISRPCQRATWAMMWAAAPKP